MLVKGATDDVMPWKRFDLYIVKQKELVNSRFVGNFRCYDPLAASLSWTTYMYRISVRSEPQDSSGLQLQNELVEFS